MPQASHTAVFLRPLSKVAVSDQKPLIKLVSMTEDTRNRLVQSSVMMSSSVEGIPLESDESKTETSKANKIPAGAIQSYLLKGKGKKKSHAPIWSFSTLARRLAMGNIDFNSFEAIMLAKMKDLPKKDRHSLLTRKLYDESLNDKAVIDEMLVIFDKLMADPKYLCGTGGLLRFGCLYRICLAIEKHIEEFKYLETSHKELVYIQWLALTLHRKAAMAEEVLKNNYESIANCLLGDLEEYAKDYSKQTTNLRGLPRVFNFGRIEAFVDVIINNFGQVLDDVTLHKILNVKSLCLWNNGQFADALTNMAVVLEFWIKNFEDVDRRVELGKSVVPTFSEMLSVVCDKKLDPAINFVDLICEKLSSRYQILPYLVTIHYSRNPELSDKCDAFQEKYPGIEHFKHHPKFEGALTKPSMTKETKQFFVSEMLRTIELPKTTSDQMYVSPKVLQDMTDVRVLELLSDGKFDEAIDMIVAEGHKGIMPSDQVVKAILDNVGKDLDKIHSLRQALPPETESYDVVSNVEVGQRLMNVYKESWVKDRQEEAVNQLLDIFKSVIENDYPVSDDMFSDLVKKCLMYVRLFGEELLFKLDDETLFEAIVAKGKSFVKVHDNFELLGQCWETYFFSSEFKHQKKAEDMFDEIPNLPRYLDFDQLIGRAARFGDEAFFRKLLEIALKFDLDQYEKCRTLESLLVLQCKLESLTRYIFYIVFGSLQASKEKSPLPKTPSRPRRI